MINKLAGLSVFLLLVLVFSIRTFACDLYLPCENIKEIVVSKGTDHLFGGEERIVFVVCVDVDETKVNLKESVANCSQESIVIKTDSTSIVVPKTDFPSGGYWFCIVRQTPREALDTAMSLCPDKVKSYLSESELQANPQKP